MIDIYAEESLKLFGVFHQNAKFYALREQMPNSQWSLTIGKKLMLFIHCTKKLKPII